MSYSEEIARALQGFPIGIDLDVQVTGRPPTAASSEFLTNKEQGDWAERLVLQAINSCSQDFCAVAYGRSESLTAGDEGFEEFYASYQNELNTIGKRPDILIFSRVDLKANPDLSDKRVVKLAKAAIEVRSSSFLIEKYNEFMFSRAASARAACGAIRQEVLREPLRKLLQEKNPELLRLIESATESTFDEISFRLSSWSTTEDLKRLTSLLKSLKAQIGVLHKRDFLSITPKLEDIALVNRWIQEFDVPHFYLQVFFDKAYVIGFDKILRLAKRSEEEGKSFTIEEDIKNQGKTTIKVKVDVGREVIGKIDMPTHESRMKELERGRLLFYVSFIGGRGYLDWDVFDREVLNAH